MVISAAAPGGERHGRPQRQKSTLSPSRRQLIELMQTINFGRLESLQIREGEPVLDPLPRPKVEIRFPGDNGPRPELKSSDFALKQQVIELFAYLDKTRDGQIDVLEVKHGLPFRMIVSQLPGQSKQRPAA